MRPIVVEILSNCRRLMSMHKEHPGRSTDWIWEETSFEQGYYKSQVETSSNQQVLMLQPGGGQSYLENPTGLKGKDLMMMMINLG